VCVFVCEREREGESVCVCVSFARILLCGGGGGDAAMQARRLYKRVYSSLRQRSVKTL
jgi:hypothetical protein